MRKTRGFVGEIIYKTWNWHSFHLSLLKSNQICPYHTMFCSTSSSSRNLTPSDHPKPGIAFGSKPMVGDFHSPPNPQYPLALLVIEPNKHPHELNLIAKRANVRYPAKHICVSWSSSLFTLWVYIYILNSFYLFICFFICICVYVHIHVDLHSLLAFFSLAI